MIGVGIIAIAALACLLWHCREERRERLRQFENLCDALKNRRTIRQELEEAAPELMRRLPRE